MSDHGGSLQTLFWKNRVLLMLPGWSMECLETCILRTESSCESFCCPFVRLDRNILWCSGKWRSYFQGRSLWACSGRSRRAPDFDRSESDQRGIRRVL